MIGDLRSCGGCRFFRHTIADEGECHGNPPQITGTSSMRPKVEEGDLACSLWRSHPKPDQTRGERLVDLSN